MKTNPLIILAIVAFLPLGIQAQSLVDKYKRQTTSPREYVCFKTSEPLKIDGKLTETAWQKAAETAPFEDISGEGFAIPKYETRARMLWDDNYLYIGAVLEEDNIKALLNQRDTIIYYDNDFEVFIDPDGDGVNYFEIETNAKATLFDLMLDKPYRSNGNFVLQWNCPGIQLAVHNEGTLNNDKDKDSYWSVEMAIPYQAITLNFDKPLKAGNVWRINFSRVEWLKKGGPEENWVWSATGKIDMHMPERWGYLYFTDSLVGTNPGTLTNPYNKDIYKVLWALFYAEKDYYETHKYFAASVDALGLTAADKALLPDGCVVEVEGAKRQFMITITDVAAKQRYSVNNDGKFSLEAADHVESFFNPQ